VRGGTCLPHAGLVRGQDAPILEWSPPPSYLEWGLHKVLLISEI
jgi:hypothetical protein